jgi:type III restriction enzyme
MEGKKNIDHLIINTPYDCPSKYWEQDPQSRTFHIMEGKRRSAGYVVADTRTKDPAGRFVSLDLVNRIRKRVDNWRVAGYPGVITVTRKLLDHWHDREARELKFYFCQLEAIETSIWWVEAPESHKQGIAIQGDGGAWERVCNKMATGTGKTTVMAMIIAWQVLNKVVYPKDRRFSRAVFIVTPGLTVKERLQVLRPSAMDNYYDAFNIVPGNAMRQKLNRLELLIENWHSLMPLKESDRSVVKKGKESDEAFTQRVLGRLVGYRDLLVINDEAHHAYRIPAELKRRRVAGMTKEEQEEATRWIEGLDRLHKTRRILRCFDLSATPFAPTGKKTDEEFLFPWIISDFGLNDAIEAGLVKTPRVVIRDDALPSARDYRSRLYHIYNDETVKDDLNQRGVQPSAPLPQLVKDAYLLLGSDWLYTRNQWKEKGHTIPPVMLTVTNTTATAARIEYAFNSGDILLDELQAPNKTLRVDSTILGKAEIGEKSSSSNKEYEARLKVIIETAPINEREKARCLAMKKEELLREIVDNVGKRDKAGVDIQKVISVAMLSEGWDAKNVTHIMGLRAFTSQLLCEQVVGRGLRRTSYETDTEGRFKPEYVNVFGVPFSFLPHEGGDGEGPGESFKTAIEVLPERKELEIRWPNVLRIDTVVKPTLTVDWDRVEDLEIDPSQTPMSADLSPIVNGQTDVSNYTTIELEKIAEKFRLQKVIFEAARRITGHLNTKHFKGDLNYLAFQVIRHVEAFVAAGKLVIPSLFHQDELRKRVLFALNIDRIVEHVVRFIRQENVERLEPVFDQEMPILSTGDMRTWYTSKPNNPTTKSHISHVVYDSTWEAAEANVLEKSDSVKAYAKNDHLGFEVLYSYQGVVRKYIPDFLIRLANGKLLVLEVKGKDSQQNKAKRAALDQWVQAVNSKGGFGAWCWDVSKDPNNIHDILAKHG